MLKRQKQTVFCIIICIAILMTFFGCAVNNTANNNDPAVIGETVDENKEGNQEKNTEAKQVESEYFKPDYNSSDKLLTDEFFDILKKDGYIRDGEVFKNYNTKSGNQFVNITPKSISDNIENAAVFYNKNNCFLMADNKIYNYDTFGGKHIYLCPWDYDGNGTNDIVSYEIFGSGVSYCGVRIFDMTKKEMFYIVLKNILWEKKFDFDYRDGKVYLDNDLLSFDGEKFVCGSVLYD